MPLENAFTDRQAIADSRVALATVQLLKYFEDAVVKLGRNADALVNDAKDPLRMR